MGKVNDLTGQKFGRLTAIKIIGLDKIKRNKVWLCQCECGNTAQVKAVFLGNGTTKSCGCLSKETSIRTIKKAHITNIKHGMINTRLYSIWASMKDRCYNKNNTAYKYYGGKNIAICEEWKNNFMNFYNWAMENGYQDDLSIDRINSDGNYEPSNCHWATKKEQTINRGLNSNNKSGIKGISYDKSRKKWRATIWNNYKQIDIGRYTNKEDAIKARKDAEKKYGYI